MDFYFSAAKAFEAALKDFHGQNRPYNLFALPAENGQLYVYILPARTESDIFLLGGDVRYIFSADGNQMVEKRQMHKDVLAFDSKHKAAGVREITTGYHTHVLSLSPEDSDVFYVRTREPSIPEIIVTMDKKMYEVARDGTISVSKMPK